MASKFVPYLTTFDYMPSIQSGQLMGQILDALQAGTFERQFAESWAIGIIKSRLQRAYNLDYEFTSTLPYDSSRQSYFANERIVIDFQKWVGNTQYNIGDCVIYNGIGYLCQTQNKDNTFIADNWQNIGFQGQLWYVPTPYQIFYIEPQQNVGSYTAGFYNVGDMVWFLDNHTYTCIIPTAVIDSDWRIQYRTYKDVPPVNTYPNDPQFGKLAWTDNGIYTVTNDPPTLPSDNPDIQPIWAVGDNRDPMMVQAVVDLALWKLHSRIAPQNIPKLRDDNYNKTIQWLDAINHDEIQLNVPYLQPKQGRGFRWGGNTKKINGY